jgi:hypothetical protein
MFYNLWFLLSGRLVSFLTCLKIQTTRFSCKVMAVRGQTSFYKAHGHTLQVTLELETVCGTNTSFF